MKSTIKTVILAAAGAALLIASPAFAKTRHSTAAQVNAKVTMLQPYQEQQSLQEGFVAPIQGDTFGQIRGEYLKDGPSHNGSNY